MPDQCAGGNVRSLTQQMLMQCKGSKIWLLPAWPKDWNCDFRLHAPHRTTVEGRVVDGQVVELKVTPEARRKDVVVCAAQETPGHVGETRLDGSGGEGGRLGRPDGDLRRVCLRHLSEDGL